MVKQKKVVWKMINLGLDFGSTYTTVSIYREDTQTLETLILNQTLPFIPSVAALMDGQFEFGRAAKSLTGKKDARVFKAFKMLLPETNQKKLAERGFDQMYTPEVIAKYFLENVLRQVLKNLNENEIETLVIGVPEIWNEGISTLDGRTMLRNICRDMKFVKEVKVVSEPAAASAFFAHNFFVTTGKKFEGKILLVDYGGGTLDITLTDVLSGTGPNGTNTVEIKVLERTGAGENEEREVGKAGIVYMETVMEEAIKRSGILKDTKEFVYDGKFYKAVDELEQQLQDRTQKIQDVFEEFGLDEEELNEIRFVCIDYRDESVDVTYGLLLEVYNRVIRPVFDEKLRQMIAYMDEEGIQYMDRNQDIFKIALVGGFGNYYLVKKQLEDTFKFNAYDKRRKNIILNKSDCEKAISLGAALLAAGIIGIRNTASYSIGVWAYNANKQVCPNYAIRYKQDIVFDKVYFARGSVDNEIIVIQAISGGFDRFLVNFGHHDKTAMVALAKEEFSRKLANVVQNQYHTAVVGFSLDSSGVVSLHIHDYDMLEGRIGEEDHVVELTRLGDLFEVTTAGTGKV